MRHGRRARRAPGVQHRYRMQRRCMIPASAYIVAPFPDARPEFLRYSGGDRRGLMVKRQASTAVAAISAPEDTRAPEAPFKQP